MAKNPILKPFLEPYECVRGPLLGFWVCWFHFRGFHQTKPNQWLEIPNFWHFMSQIGLYWPLKWPSWFFSKNAHFGCYIGFIGPFKTHFTLAQFWFWAFFLDFFLQKTYFRRPFDQFFLAPFKKRLIKITFEIFFSNVARIKSYGVKFFFFEMLISHWPRLWLSITVHSCDRAVKSFPKWYDT